MGLYLYLITGSIDPEDYVSGIITSRLHHTRNNLTTQPYRQTVGAEPISYRVPGIKIIITRISLLAGLVRAGIHRAIGFGKYHLHIVAVFVHVSRKGKLNYDFLASRTGNMVLCRFATLILGYGIWNPWKNIAENKVVVNGNIYLGIQNRRTKNTNQESIKDNLL